MIEWSRIETVLLDMDGTLLDLYFDNYFWQEYLPVYWGKRHGLDAESAKRELLPRFRSREGTLSWSCLEYWTNELGIDVLKLKSDVEDLIQVRPHALEFLNAVKNSGRKTAMVTNAHRDLIRLKLSRTGIGAYFEHIVSAHDLGTPKEHVAFWSKLHDRLPYSGATTLLVDDNLTVLRAAREYGIAYLYTIAKPDSRAPVRDSGEFMPIESFREVLPAI